MTSHLRTESNTFPSRAIKHAPTGLLQRKCACGNHTLAGGECEACGTTRINLQRRAGDNQSEHAEVPPIVHEVLRSTGQLLDQATRAFMEPRFGHDFSQVHVHTDSKAAESARAVNALAYTVGRDVVFGDGQYAPGAAEGRRLLAHELTHTIQQSSAIQGMQKLETANPTDAAEQEAEAASRSIAEGRRFTVRSGAILRIARQEAPDAGVPTDAGMPNRDPQLECVKRLGGCPNTRPGGIPTPEEIAGYNEQCRQETAYAGPDVTPTDDECHHTPAEEQPQAQVCARPLHYPVLNLAFNHAYVVAPPDRYAIIAPLCTPTDGGPDSLIWGGTAARKWDNSPDPCGDVPECVACRPKRGVSDVKRCLRDAFDTYNSPVLHKALGPNSNTFAGALARTCCDGIVGSPFIGITPGWDDPPAPSRSATCPAGSPACT